MKVSVNDIEIFSLSETQKKVIKNDINEDDFDNDMHRRLHYILKQKYEECFKRLKAEWEPKLESRVSSIPTDRDQLAELIMSQPDYKCRKMRDEEESALCC